MNHETPNDPFDSTDEIPSPDMIAEKMRKMPRKVNLRLYAEAIHGLRKKGYSYAEIATWIAKELGAEVTRSQVSYILNAPSLVLDAEDQEAEEAAEADRLDEELGDDAERGINRS